MQAEDISADLQSIMMDISDKFISADGKYVNYQVIQNSHLYFDYIKIAIELQGNLLLLCHNLQFTK